MTTPLAPMGMADFRVGSRADDGRASSTPAGLDRGLLRCSLWLPCRRDGTRTARFLARCVPSLTEQEVSRVERTALPQSREAVAQPPAERPFLVRRAEDDWGMAQNFLGCDRDQSLLLPPDLREWLDEDHLAWFVIEAIEELDLEPFYAAYRADGHGRAAHDPKMMLTLLAYAYCVGERSSRGIERRCREDVAFRVVCANRVPDYATVARFRVRHQQALAELFGQVLGLCAEAGLVRAGVIAVDGSKFRAAASDAAIRSYEEIAAEVLAEAEHIDAAEDERFGAARGDELPGQLASRGGRRAWLRDAKRRLDAERAAKPEPVPQDRERRLEICHRRLVEDWRAEHQANRAYEAYRARGVMKDGRRFGCPANPYEPSEVPVGKINTTDPDARRMKFGRNFIPAYNAQAAVTAQQIIVAAELTTERAATSSSSSRSSPRQNESRAGRA